MCCRCLFPTSAEGNNLEGIVSFFPVMQLSTEGTSHPVVNSRRLIANDNFLKLTEVVQTDGTAMLHTINLIYQDDVKV